MSDAGPHTTDLGPQAQVGVGHELGVVVGVGVHLQVRVEHADGDAGQRHHEAEDLPRPSCRDTGSAQVVNIILLETVSFFFFGICFPLV